MVEARMPRPNPAIPPSPIPCIQGYHVHLHSPVQAHFRTKKTLALDRYSQIRSRKEVAGHPPGRRGVENNLNGRSLHLPYRNG